MGMAYLFKFASPSLGLQADPVAALPLLHRVATVATVATPQHAFIFGRLLLSKLPPDEIRAPLPSNALAHFVPAGSTVVLEGWKYMERAAHLGHELSQFLVGEAYRTAQPPFLVQDPLLSIHYYSLASQQGKMEADMGLSIWFLHGSPGEDGLEKDPVLAFMFAKKAAKKGLPMAELTMGFCAEEGIGCPKSLQTTIEWYKKAKEHGNSVAAERLNALSQSSPNAL
ncbi:hypothetical protein DXG03_003757 [Asterophora parasitica]|uniref:Uncharacterized protein n=1 Tax=Asterophora parasitica TaxID=117018 RepID=A0A9P7KBQ0_9AGAR|nr:hypothetical protein DXG03_003757 [Asterophora parasitica]